LSTSLSIYLNKTLYNFILVQQLMQNHGNQLI